MTRWSKIIIIALVLFSSLFFVFIRDSYAGNGTRMLGFSSRDAAMAGATTASSEDTSCLVRNPAGLVRIGNRIDMEYENIIPHDVSMRTEGAVVTPGVPSLSNLSKIQKSTINYLPGGNVGISYRLPGTDKYPISVGCGAFTMAGIAVNYPSSRLNEALAVLGTGVYDKMVDLRAMRIAPGISVAFTDKLSFGVTGNIAIQALRNDLAFAEGGFFREEEDSGKWDFAPGGGFTLGLLYRFNEMLNLGASYESHTWMGNHYKYKNTLKCIDEPPVINVGMSLKPVKQLEVTFDTRYINWTDVDIAKRKPIHGGFGWQDQWVFATGGEYTFLNDKLKLRLGYNYGKSPIQRKFVFANALFPVIAEHHLTTGFSYYVTKNLSVDFVWEHHFMGVQVDNGTGDIYSQNGVGTKITGAGEVIGAGIGYKY